MDDDKYKVSFAHFRVPDIPELSPRPRRGEPDGTDWIQYHRGEGWSYKSSGMGGQIWERIKPLSCGGMTNCVIFDKERENVVLAVGRAVCSYSDHFNYKRGRDIAFGRAKAALEKGSE